VQYRYDSVKQNTETKPKCSFSFLPLSPAAGHLITNRKRTVTTTPLPSLPSPHTRSLTHSLPPSITHTLTPSLSLSHTHTHTLSLSHTHSLSHAHGLNHRANQTNPIQSFAFHNTITHSLTQSVTRKKVSNVLWSSQPASNDETL
jgi:hypothetical protein